MPSDVASRNPYTRMFGLSDRKDDFDDPPKKQPQQPATKYMDDK